MAILEKLRDDIADHFGKTSDFPFKLRVEERILQVRSILIKQQQDKKFADREAVQTAIIPLKKADTSRDYLLVSPRDCQLLYADGIPQLIKIFKFPFEYVGTITETTAFAYVKPEQVKYHVSNPNFKNVSFYSYYNNVLQIFAQKTIDKVRVRGMFYDPTQLSKYNSSSTSDSECYTSETPFPIAGDLLDPLRRMVIDSFNGDFEQDSDVSDENPDSQ